MRLSVIVSVERRYIEFEGRYYVQGIEDEKFFQRYIDAFNLVYVLARVEKSNNEPEGFKIISDKRIRFLPVYTKGVGISKFLTLYCLLKKKLDSKLIIRTPGLFSYLIFICCFFLRKSFFLEVVANPLQEAQNSSQVKLVNKTLSLVLPLIFRLQLYFAKGASFVTNHEIQKAFLSEGNLNNPKYNFSYSSINLGSEFFANNNELSERRGRSNKQITLLFVGVLDRPFKGLDIFINILEQLPNHFRGIVVGDGVLLKQYKEQAISLIQSDRIEFKGYVYDEIQKIRFYRCCDVFILCSRREGLPRVLIEAMASGAPCLSTDVSGARELLDEEYIFPVDNSEVALLKLHNLLNHDLYSVGNKNLVKAKEFSSSKLRCKRNKYYSFIKNCY